MHFSIETWTINSFEHLRPKQFIKVVNKSRGLLIDEDIYPRVVGEGMPRLELKTH